MAAVSVGIIDGEPRLDLCYDEDVAAEVDMNIVCTGTGDFVEVQGTGEAGVFARDQLNALLDLGVAGCAKLAELQRRGARDSDDGRLLLATRNAKKLAELQRILDAALGLGEVDLVGLGDVPAYDEVPETGLTFADNALLKAREGAGTPGCHGRRRLRPRGRRAQRHAGCVQRPLVRPARRRPGEPATSCWPRSSDVDDENRGAAFVCAAALVLPGRREFAVSGRCAAACSARRAARRLRLRPDLRAGRRHPDQRRAAPAEKDAISHRGKAFRDLAAIVRTQLPS